MYYDLDSKPITRDEWIATFDNYERRIVGSSHVGRGVWVSTVWLGLDHSFGGSAPLIFETMVFDHEDALGGHSEIMVRYATLEGAREGHQRIAEYAWMLAWVPPYRWYLRTRYKVKEWFASVSRKRKGSI